MFQKIYFVKVKNSIIHTIMYCNSIYALLLKPKVSIKKMTAIIQIVYSNGQFGLKILIKEGTSKKGTFVVKVIVKTLKLLYIIYNR